MSLKTLVGAGSGIPKKIRIRNKSFRIRNPALNDCTTYFVPIVDTLPIPG